MSDDRIVVSDPSPLDVMAARLHRACLVVRYCLPSDGPGGLYSTWPAYRHDYWDWGAEHWGDDPDEAAALAGPTLPRFRATPAEIDAAVPTLALLDGLERDHRRVVAMRAVMAHLELLGGWRRIGARIGRSHTTARKLHDEAVEHALRAEDAAATKRVLSAVKTQGPQRRAA